jgi:hypothetical protein
MHTTLACTLLLAGAVSVAAPAGAQAGATPDPCVLVNQADAKQAVGEAPGKGHLTKAGAARTCVYKINGVLVLGVQETPESLSTFQQQLKALPGPVKHLAGIGPDTYSTGGGFVRLWDKGYSFSFGIVGSNPLATQTKLAKKVVSRL